MLNEMKIVLVIMNALTTITSTRRRHKRKAKNWSERNRTSYATNNVLKEYFAVALSKTMIRVTPHILPRTNTQHAHALILDTVRVMYISFKINIYIHIRTWMYIIYIYIYQCILGFIYIFFNTKSTCVFYVTRTLKKLRFFIHKQIYIFSPCQFWTFH